MGGRHACPQDIGQLKYLMEDLVRGHTEFDGYRTELVEMLFDQGAVIIDIVHGQVSFKTDGHFDLAALGPLEDQVAQVDLLFPEADAAI